MFRSSVVKAWEGRVRNVKIKARRKLHASKDFLISTDTYKGHPWMTKDRERSLLVELERVRNLNMHTINWDNKL